MKNSTARTSGLRAEILEQGATAFRRETPDPAGDLLLAVAEPFAAIDDADLEPLLARIGDARLVLLGEASHGTSEFYRLRARITRELVARRGFTILAAEADWPDAARVDHYVRDLEHRPPDWIAFSRFPTWMWRNQEFRALVEWLRNWNGGRPPAARTGFFGLDLYSLNTSIAAVLAYLDETDAATAAIARQRYGCLTPWQADPAAYGLAALNQRYRSCEGEVARMLGDLLESRLRLAAEAHGGGERYFDALQNAHLIAEAEKYYRVMYYGGAASWNLRDRHMFATLERLLEHHGPAARAVVWAHNSHLGNAAATEMSARGETNLGELCRRAYGDAVYAIGFGTDHGTVAAASDWDAPMEIKAVRPAHPRSYERLCHDSGIPRFLLPLRPAGPLREALTEPRLERAIGVIYRPETELASHYFAAHLPLQFDEYVFFDATEALRPLVSHELEGMPDTYPFGL